MGRRSEVRITQKIADSATTEKVDQVIWDAQQTGLGLRVRQSGHKTWVYRWRARRRQVIAQFGTYKDSSASEVIMSVADARVAARAWRAAIDEGKDPRSASQSKGATLADLWPAFIEHKGKREGLSAKTLAGYDRHFATNISHPKFGIAAMPVTAISRKDVIRLQRAIADQGRRTAETRFEEATAAGKVEEYLDKLEAKLPTAGNGEANSTVLTISSFFSWMVGSAELDHSPCEKITKLPTAGRNPDSILDREDAFEAIALIRKHAVNDGHRDILLLLILTAQRCADIRDRDWEDVCLDDPDIPLPYLRIHKHKSRRRTKADKVIPLGPEALAILLERWPGSTLTPRRTADSWVVEDELGDGSVYPLSPCSAWAGLLPKVAGPVFPGNDPTKPLTDLWHPWRAVAEHATRKRVRLSDVHGLRHAAASLMVAAGVPEDLIKQVLHHGAIETTRGYMHVTADVFARLGEFLTPGLGRR